jgi:hypothetical protein
MISLALFVSGFQRASGSEGKGSAQVTGKHTNLCSGTNPQPDVAPPAGAFDGPDMSVAKTSAP